jgi:hypothetical protein
VWSCCWFIIILERKWRYDFLHSLQIKHFSILDYRELKINEWSSALRSFFRFAIEIQLWIIFEIFYFFFTLSD